MAYKQKTKQYIINSAKQPAYFIQDDFIILNLNANFPKKDNFSKLNSNLRELKSFGNVINLCNLASLCYKFEMEYASQETLDCVKKIVKIIKDHNFTIVQNNVYNYGEIDMKPIDKLVSFDPTHDIIYCNNILIECLKVLGYVDNQLYDIIDFSKNLRHVIPEDLADKLPIQNKKNSGCYQMIKELLC